MAESIAIELVIHLVPYQKEVEYDRIGDEEDRYTKILGVLIPTVILPVTSGRNIGVLVESAVTNFRLKKAGFDSAEEIRERFRRYCEREKR